MTQGEEASLTSIGPALQALDWPYQLGQYFMMLLKLQNIMFQGSAQSII